MIRRIDIIVKEDLTLIQNAEILLPSRETRNMKYIITKGD